MGERGDDCREGRSSAEPGSNGNGQAGERAGKRPVTVPCWAGFVKGSNPSDD